MRLVHRSGRGNDARSFKRGQPPFVIEQMGVRLLSEREYCIESLNDARWFIVDARESKVFAHVSFENRKRQATGISDLSRILLNPYDVTGRPTLEGVIGVC